MNVHQHFLADCVITSDDACWGWTGTVNPRDGDRPSCGFDGEWHNAAKWAYLLFVDDVPDGFHVEHVCRNRYCVNPAHLDAVPPEINYARERRTHCKRGHELTTENRVCTGRTKAGTRRWTCRLCRQAFDRKRYATEGRR